MTSLFEIPHKHWREIHHRGYLRKINPQMLLPPHGAIYPTKIGATRSKQKEYANVCFDRDYVLEYLRDKIIEPLCGVSLVDIQSLIKEAYEK